MSYQLLTSYFSSAVQYLNSMLTVPVKFVQNSLSLQTESLPSFLQAPLAFTSMLLMTFFVILGYANNFICSLVGLVYPLTYGFNLLQQEPSDTTLSPLITLNKYWMLYGVLTLVESLIGFILEAIPGYYYAKLALLYMLVRNDFAMTTSVYSRVETYYANSTLAVQFQALLSMLLNKFGTLTSKYLKRQKTIKSETVSETVTIPEGDPLGSTN